MNENVAGWQRSRNMRVRVRDADEADQCGERWRRIGGTTKERDGSVESGG